MLKLYHSKNLALMSFNKIRASAKFSLFLFNVPSLFLVKGDVGHRDILQKRKRAEKRKFALLSAHERGPFVWQIFEVPSFCSSRPVVNVDAKLTFSSEVKQIALDDLKCRLRDGTKVSCVDVTACFEYSGIGIERRLGENFRGA
jgi:Integrin alpha